MLKDSKGDNQLSINPQTPTSLFVPGIDKDLQYRKDSMDSQIDTICEKATIAGYSIIPQILAMSKDPKELNRLSKAFALISKILKENADVEEKLAILNASKKHPEWFGLVFKTFDQFDRDFEHLVSTMKDTEN